MELRVWWGHHWCIVGKSQNLDPFLTWSRSRLVTPYEPTVLSLTDQVNAFLPTAGTKPAAAPWTSSDTLFSFWIGINDIGNSYYQSGDRSAWVMKRLHRWHALKATVSGFLIHYWMPILILCQRSMPWAVATFYSSMYRPSIGRRWWVLYPQPCELAVMFFIDAGARCFGPICGSDSDCKFQFQAGKQDSCFQVSQFWR